MQLKANKTSMYKLAKRYIPDLPPMRKMTFDKTPRTRSWWLEGFGHKVYLGAGWGCAFIMDNQTTVGHSTIAELRELGMIED